MGHVQGEEHTVGLSPSFFFYIHRPRDQRGLPLHRRRLLAKKQLEAQGTFVELLPEDLRE